MLIDVNNFFVAQVVPEIYAKKTQVSKKLQGGPERSRQSNLAVFAVEGGLDSKFPHVK